MAISKKIKASLLTSFLSIVPYLLGIGFLLYLFNKFSKPIGDLFSNLKTSEITNTGVKSDNEVLIDTDLTVNQKSFYVGFKNSINSLLGTNTKILQSLIKNVSNDDLKKVYQYALLNDKYDMIQALRNEWLIIEIPFVYDSLKAVINQKFKTALDVTVF